jgi:hypothetical protein
MPLTITRRERDAIYQEVMTDLSGIGDIWIVLRKRDYETAQAYRRRFEDDMRLLDDLGWSDDAPGERFTITMPERDLARALRRLNEMAEISLRGDESEAAVSERLRIAQAVYGEVLDQISVS